QRGGSPTLRDRTMASLMGIHAIECIQKQRMNRLVVYRNGIIDDVDIEEGLNMKKTISEEDIARAKLLS
ncbi:MAG TPA: ATP-dependent 6-phosphofructokinase, partial [Bacillota bacterium]|nr:ATP-dependent 6-phosphofructokinase [Bacillota bacterium]